MKQFAKSSLELLKAAAVIWNAHSAPRLGAAVSYYTIFAISPMFLIVLTILGFWFGENAQGHLFSQLEGLIGQEGAKALQSIIKNTSNETHGLFATVMAIGAVLVGATGVFVELQASLNALWDVQQKPGRGMIEFVKKRFLSFTLILSIGFLLLVSLVVSAGLTAAGNYMAGLMPQFEAVWQVVNFFVAFGVITVLFAILLKYLPDVTITWRDVWAGAAMTALLFSFGKWLLGVYLGKSSVISTYGAAGSLVVVLVWVYYSAQIFFFGASLTKAYAHRFGTGLKPEKHAEWAPTVADGTATSLPEDPSTGKPKPPGKRP